MQPTGSYISAYETPAYEHAVVKLADRVYLCIVRVLLVIS